MHRSTCRDLLQDELEITEQKNAQEYFDAPVAIKCSPGTTVGGFYKLISVDIPEYDIYKDDTTEVTCPKATPEELDPTPDAAPDHYLNASVLLPRW